MHLTIPRLTLARELALLAPVASHKTTIPILSSVRLEAHGDTLQLIATDLECGLASTIPATVAQEGALCIPAKRLLDFVRSLAGDSVTIKTSENHYATVTSGRARARIAGQSVESFPELPQAPAAVFGMDARALSRTLSRVAFAISMEESRFTLNGALLEVSGALVRCVATDGHRLAFVEQDGATTAAPLKTLVPKVAIGHYAKLADMSEGGARVEMSADDGHLFFSVGSRLLIARKITGNFPDYTRVLPKGEAYVVVDREAFAAAISRVAQFADERSRAARFAFGDGEIAITAQSMECGESDESVTCEGALAVEVGFNAQYILDALGAITHPRAAFFLSDAKSAGEIRPMAGAGTEQDPYRVATDARFVVMPMRI
jgi:DNA polymerase-3 subunit beta